MTQTLNILILCNQNLWILRFVAFSMIVNCYNDYIVSRIWLKISKSILANFCSIFVIQVAIIIIILVPYFGWSYIFNYFLRCVNVIFLYFWIVAIWLIPLNCSLIKTWINYFNIFYFVWNIFEGLKAFTFESLLVLFNFFLFKLS